MITSCSAAHLIHTLHQKTELRHAKIHNRCHKDRFAIPVHCASENTSIICRATNKRHSKKPHLPPPLPPPPPAPPDAGLCGNGSGAGTAPGARLGAYLRMLPSSRWYASRVRSAVPCSTICCLLLPSAGPAGTRSTRQYTWAGNHFLESVWIQYSNIRGRVQV
jgi:hypothetical protein